MQNKLYTAHTIRHGITKPTCSLISLQPCYDKEHMIFYKLVKVCKYNLRWAYLTHIYLWLDYFFHSTVCYLNCHFLTS